jgi:hypothetical protein
MKRVGLVVTVLAVLGLCSVAFAASAAGPKPKAGTWKFKDADGGFRLVPGAGKDKGKLFLTGVHSRTQNFVGCPEKPEPIVVAGKFPLKWQTLNGSYPTWTVGKPGVEERYSDSNSGLISIPAKVTVGGKAVPKGGIKMEFSYENPTVFTLLIIEYSVGEEREPCVTYAENAAHG